MSNDKLEALLEGTFQAGIAEAHDDDIVQRMLANLHRRKRRRTLFLAGTGLLALVFAAVTAQPAILALVDWLASSEPLVVADLTATMQNLGIGIPLLLVIALAPWLLALLDDQV